MEFWTSKEIPHNAEGLGKHHTQVQTLNPGCILEHSVHLKGSTSGKLTRILVKHPIACVERGLRSGRIPERVSPLGGSVLSVETKVWHRRWVRSESCVVRQHPGNDGGVLEPVHSSRETQLLFSAVRRKSSNTCGRSLGCSSPKALPLPRFGPTALCLPFSSGVRSLEEVCLQVTDLLPGLRKLRNLLPEHGCLLLSPGNFWQNDRERFNADPDIIKTIHQHEPKTLQTSATLKGEGLESQGS